MKKGCGNCQHYFITYDPKKPWGCRKFNFKSAFLPNYIVKNSSGMDCAYYKLKACLKNSEGNTYDQKFFKTNNRR